MQLRHQFVVPLPPDQVWAALTDVNRIGPCLPGATITSVEGDSFTGSVSLKIGPARLQFAGRGCYLEKDENARRIVLLASGNEPRGTGAARATITGLLRDLPEGTEVAVETELSISGRAAQYGRGVMNDIGSKLLAQFAEQLSAEIRLTSSEPPAPNDIPFPSTKTPTARPEPEAVAEVSLGRIARELVAERASRPAVTLPAGVLLGILVARLLRRLTN